MVHIESIELKGMENKSNLNFRHIMSTCDVTVSAIEHNQNLCADLTESHVDTSVEFYFDKSICALNDPCNTSYTNKLHLVQLVTCAGLFSRISPTECLCYTMHSMPIDIDKMLEKISVITFLSFLNTAHSCKFTFVLIEEHVVDTFHVHAICVTYDKLAESE
jgi:hypothetical protein